MTMTDPTANLLTRIRNALSAGKAHLEVPASRLSEAIVAILKREGFLEDFRRIEVAPQDKLRIYLKYDPDGVKIINRIQRVSTPGRRVYRGAADVPRVRNGMGIAIVSTSQGVLTDKECRAQKLGGEVLCLVW